MPRRMALQGSSENFGEVLLSADGRDARAYRALRPVLCAECPHIIAVGELFTRRELQGVALVPQCRECAPFEPKAEEKNMAEALIKNLLSSSTQALDPVAPNERAHQEVQKRIRPALESVNKKKA